MKVKSYGLVALLAIWGGGVYTPCPYGAERVAPVRLDENGEADRLAPKYNAEREVRLWDGTRVDMVNQDFAIEVDWAKSTKWAEAIGQSLYYATVTGKRPGIILLTRDRQADQRFIYRCQTVTAKYGIKLWVEEVE